MEIFPKVLGMVIFLKIFSSTSAPYSGLSFCSYSMSSSNFSNSYPTGISRATINWNKCQGVKILTHFFLKN